VIPQEVAEVFTQNVRQRNAAYDELKFRFQEYREQHR